VEMSTNTVKHGSHLSRCSLPDVSRASVRMEKRNVDVPNVLKDNAEILLTALRKVVVCHAQDLETDFSFK